MACADQVPSHYLNQGWNIVNWILRNKRHWNLNRNSCILIHENAFENVVWEMAAILSGPQCVMGGIVGVPLIILVIMTVLNDNTAPYLHVNWIGLSWETVALFGRYGQPIIEIHTENVRIMNVWWWCISTLWPGQNGHHIADNKIWITYWLDVLERTIE